MPVGTSARPPPGGERRRPRGPAGRARRRRRGRRLAAAGPGRGGSTGHVEQCPAATAYRGRHRSMVAAGARVDGSGDDRPRPGHGTSSSRSPPSSPTTTSRSWPRGPTSSSTSPTRRSPRWTPFVVEMHTRSGPARRDPGVDRSPWRRPARRRWRSSRSTSPSRRHGAAVRQLDRHRPALPRRLPARHRGLPALPLVDVSSVKELVKRWYPGVNGGRPAQGGQPPGPRRHPRERRRAALLPRAGVRPDAAPRRTAPAPDVRFHDDLPPTTA